MTQSADWFDIQWLDGKSHAILTDGLVPFDKLHLLLRDRARRHKKVVHVTSLNDDIYIKAVGDIPSEKIVPTHAYFSDNHSVHQR